MKNQKSETELQNMSPQARRCRKRFLKFFPEGFQDPEYFDWERDYKQAAHERWNEELSRKTFRSLLEGKAFFEIAARAVRIESKTNLLFSFEKMALRDAVKSEEGAQMFAEGLYALLHGAGKIENKFARWTETLDALPRRRTRVSTWTSATVFPFLAQPDRHVFLKPNTTRAAAREYGFDFQYNSRPNWTTYANMLEFVETIRRDQADLKPRDVIDLQSFVWTAGSEEYKRIS